MHYFQKKCRKCSIYILYLINFYQKKKRLLKKKRNHKESKSLKSTIINSEKHFHGMVDSGKTSSKTSSIRSNSFLINSHGDKKFPPFLKDVYYYGCGFWADDFKCEFTSSSNRLKGGKTPLRRIQLFHENLEDLSKFCRPHHQS